MKYLFGSPGRAVRSQPWCPGVSSLHWFGASSISNALLLIFSLDSMIHFLALCNALTPSAPYERCALVFSADTDITPIYGEPLASSPRGPSDTRERAAMNATELMEYRRKHIPV